MVDLPAPDKPVNQSSVGFCAFSRARAVLVTSNDWKYVLAARRSPKRISPAATIALLWRSTRINSPVFRFLVWIEGDWLGGGDVAESDFVEKQLLGG